MFGDEDVWGDEEACPAAHACFYGRAGAPTSPPRRPLGDAASPNAGSGSTPRRRRGVDWAGAARRMDYFISALREAEAAERPGACAGGGGTGSDATPPSAALRARWAAAPLYRSPSAPVGELRSTWSVAEAAASEDEEEEQEDAPPPPPDPVPAAPPSPPDRPADAHGGTAPTTPQAAPRGDRPEEEEEEEDGRGSHSSYALHPDASWREQALAKRCEALERALAQQQLAGALSEMRAATGALAGAALAAAAAAGSPGAAPRRRAEVAEQAAAALAAERDALASRCMALEEQLATAGDTIALMRRRAEDAESRACASSYTAAAAAPSRAAAAPPSLRVRAEVASAVAAAAALPAPERRRRLRALRLRWHPDKHADALAGLATEVTQALNAELTELQLRLGDDDWSCE